mmetsp:Transcript_11990/g.27779  ORF Transcript_11990/g.27779 Transcript_11990/m.27779 type:complete len:275 (+) Transcript_11990:272-1096(+)
MAEDETRELKIRSLTHPPPTAAAGSLFELAGFGRVTHMTFASFLSLSSSWSTDSTLIPASRLGGSSTCTTLWCLAISTPSCSGVNLSIFFFFAFMMLGNVAYRGSFSRRSVVITAGSFMPSVSSPPSTSRVTCKEEPSASSSLDANVPCGQPSSAESICPVWFASSSIACLPSKTMEGSSFATTALKSFAMCSGTVSASVTIWIARSAPIARAVRSCSCAAVGPTVMATTSVATFFSFRRTASSIAISSNGFILILTFATSTALLSGLTRILTA